MKYILESREFYSIGDVVLIQYWYNGMITPVIVLDIINRKLLITHNNDFSKIKNAPNELIKSSDVIQKKDQ